MDDPLDNPPADALLRRTLHIVGLEPMYRRDNGTDLRLVSAKVHVDADAWPPEQHAVYAIQEWGALKTGLSPAQITLLALPWVIADERTRYGNTSPA
jgi:hypothetical protein